MNQLYYIYLLDFLYLIEIIFIYIYLNENLLKYLLIF